MIRMGQLAERVEALGRAAALVDHPVVAIYKTATAQAFTNNAGMVVNFGTKETDSHNAVTVGASWVFTAPKKMVVVGAAQIQFAATNTWASGDLVIFTLSKGGTVVKTLDYWDNQVTAASLYVRPLCGAFMVMLEAGETLSFSVLQRSGGTLALHNDAQSNRVELLGLPV